VELFDYKQEVRCSARLPPLRKKEISDLQEWVSDEKSFQLAINLISNNTVGSRAWSIGLMPHTIKGWWWRFHYLCIIPKLSATIRAITILSNWESTRAAEFPAHGWGLRPRKRIKTCRRSWCFFRVGQKAINLYTLSFEVVFCTLEHQSDF